MRRTLLKRGVALALCAVLGLSLLAGCSQEGAPDLDAQFS